MRQNLFLTWCHHMQDINIQFKPDIARIEVVLCSTNIGNVILETVSRMYDKNGSNCLLVSLQCRRQAQVAGLQLAIRRPVHRKRNNAQQIQQISSHHRSFWSSNGIHSQLLQRKENN